MARKAAPISREHVILALLDEEPMHGYELHQKLSKLPGVSKIWNLKQAFFYAKLERLHKDGYIEEHSTPKEGSGPARVVFQLSPLGRRSLAAWITAPVLKARDIQQLFLVKLIIARRYGLPKTLELIHNQRLVCQSWLHNLESEIPEVKSQELDEYIVHNYKMNRERSLLNWLDNLESLLIDQHKRRK